MNSVEIELVGSFFSDLGGLHDADVISTGVDVLNGVFHIEVDDVNSNFEGLPEYQGKEAGILMFHGVHVFSMEMVRGAKALRFYDVILLSEDQIKITFSPSGYVEFSFSKLKYHKIIN